MKLFAVSIGYGYWVVRARDAREAEQVARTGESTEFSNAASYGYEESKPARVRELSLEGSAQIVGHVFQ